MRELVIDAHCDIAQAMVDLGLDLGRRQRATHFDLPRAREGGLSAQFFALFVAPDEFRGAQAWRRANAMLEAIERMLATHPRRVALARTADELRANHAAGQLSALIGIEGAHALGTENPKLVLSRLERLARRGARYLGLTWNNSNALAGASVDRGGGLTPLGRRAVRACEDLGVLIDLSHASDKTCRDVLALARRPVIASHSNARALCDVPRNLPDDLLRAIGRAGGVVGVNFFSAFVDERIGAELKRREERTRARAKALQQRYRDDRRRLYHAERRLVFAEIRDLRPVPLARLLDHVEHIAEVAGTHAVGLGSDFDGMMIAPKGLDDVRSFALLARALRHRFPPSLVRGVLGENLLRVLA